MHYDRNKLVKFEIDRTILSLKMNAKNHSIRTVCLMKKYLAFDNYIQKKFVFLRYCLFYSISLNPNKKSYKVVMKFITSQ